MSAIYGLQPTFDVDVQVIPQNPDYIAVIRLILECWLEMTANQRDVFTQVVALLGNPLMFVNPPNAGQAPKDAEARKTME